ncbi:Alkane 1-monooxygenase 2 [Thalassovita gelatinovora]|uniref:Alkane 1-monooxygenase 2 n=1 Tax=Thalassovita gelatinovora TaxID=53501 RepID=A0A0P1FYG1_THAGE|nr:alkane 1-monooxygenase [Thalassovita gelatinovora]QIZ79988.1 alkane 1-monooxygenase [Thalassovita gelatinovora]CUH65645.1 Alkane 1-monooxygenase 2 [Thalassovita gelatinovora]SER05684.1 alkane 1-monooxygenase [Thalassovita gelatinovora]
MVLFTLATLVPACLLILSALFGGVWVLIALLFITVFTLCMDRLLLTAETSRPDAEFPAGDGLSVLLALLHLPMLALAVWAIGGDSGMGGWERAGLLVGFGLFFGQISHPNAHELIHRGNRWFAGLGKMVYITLLIGHHISAHLLVHHIHVATAADPSSAHKGEGFWRFVKRGWIGPFKAGLMAENRRRARIGRKSILSHPYTHYVVGAAATLTIAAAFWGAGGCAALIGVAGYAQLQMLLSDYVQHYGLQRGLGANDKPVAVGPDHSWNTPHRYSSAMMLNAPRHSDHHIHPARHYPALRLTPDMPVLPHSLPVMAVIALWPGLWRKVMDARLAALGL